MAAGGMYVHRTCSDPLSTLWRVDGRRLVVGELPFQSGIGTLSDCGVDFTFHLSPPLTLLLTASVA